MQEKKFNPVIKQPEICYGCGACVAACPKGCLEMERDALKFHVVRIKPENQCVSCGKCSVICPANNHKTGNEDIFKRFYGQILDTTILNNSSSGGAFSAIAEVWIKNGGIVWGVRMDGKGKANFICVNNLTEISILRGSKYVEVEQPIPFREIKKQLETGKKVLFTGVPCQVQALYSFLDKKYENLLLIDLLCYGVQSPLIWEKYLEEINPSQKELTSVFMRHKEPRWEDYAIKLEYADGSVYQKSRWKDPYLLTYAKSLYNREACGECKAKAFPRISDITLGDFWQIDTIRKIPAELKTNRGVSVILVNSQVGMKILYEIQSSMVLMQIPDNVFLNMKTRYSECHRKSEDSEKFLESVKKIGFTQSVKSFISKNDLLKEKCRFRWLRIKRKIKSII